MVTNPAARNPSLIPVSKARLRRQQRNRQKPVTLKEEQVKILFALFKLERKGSKLIKRPVLCFGSLLLHRTMLISNQICPFYRTITMSCYLLAIFMREALLYVALKLRILRPVRNF